MIATERRLSPRDLLVLSLWCGLASGWLEVGTRIVCKIVPDHRTYLMSRHFVWMGPLSSLLFFLAIGLLLALATKIWPRYGGWIGLRLICFLAILPVLIVASSRIYPWAWAVLALGLASRLVAIFERGQVRMRRCLALSLAAMLGCVLVVCGLVLGADWLKERREAGRSVPAGKPPNVLLIVMDTVRADHLSLYGYARPTSPTLETLAKRGIRFDEACATAPWTLPSHASMFTGRLPHELGVDWRTALGSQPPTVAEYLGSRGYATAGFVANLLYCSYEFGLNRGFTHYEDYLVEPMSPLRMCTLGDFVLKAASDVGWRVSEILGSWSFLPGKDSLLWRYLANDPKIDAGMINQRFLNWLTQRKQPERPFFAFLNYLDAHTVYLLPPGTPYRFGRPPKTDTDVQVLVDWSHIDKLRLAPYYRTLARDCYDSCIRYMDDQLAQLLGELERRGVLDDTLIIVTSDHGEGLGEHDLFFHGESLYRTETRVPLVMALPGRKQSAVVSEPISLRDLPATIVDLTGQGTGAPFPGRTLVGRSGGPHSAEPSLAGEGAISELASPNPYDPNQGRSPGHRGAMASLADGDYVYIHNDGDGSEELFNRRVDPNEFDDRSNFEALQVVKERLRTRLKQMRAGDPAALKMRGD
jgi:arylsulfatase A-like enzyme